MIFVTILKKEILDSIYNFRYGIILALSILVIGTSIFTMYRDYCARVENYEILRPEKSEAIAIIPPTPLSIFVKGLDDNLGRAHEIDFIGIGMGSSQQGVNKLFNLFTTPDLLYIIKIVLSLCALLMGYDIITSEKERGTLKIILSNSVKRPVLLIAKWIGGFISFIVPILFVLLVTVFIVGLLPLVQFTLDDYGKIFMFLFTSVLYLAIFYAFAVFISCLTTKSVTSLVTSLFFWAIIVFVIPNLGNTISKQLVKTQSIQNLQLQQNLSWIKAVFNKNNNNNGELDLGWDKLSSAYQIEQNKRIRISEIVAQCSPAGVFTLVATNIMNTGIIDQNNLKTNVWEYYKQVKDSPTDSDGNLQGEFPVFTHKRANLHSILSQNAGSYIIMFFLVAAFFACSYVAFMKYDLR